MVGKQQEKDDKGKKDPARTGRTDWRRRKQRDVLKKAPDSLGGRVKVLREERGWSQNKLIAEMTTVWQKVMARSGQPVTQASLSRLEMEDWKNGDVTIESTKQVKSDLLLCLAETLSVSADFLLGRPAPRNIPTSPASLPAEVEGNYPELSRYGSNAEELFEIYKGLKVSDALQLLDFARHLRDSESGSDQG